MVTIGQRILGYTLQEIIGDGGMATVYRASNSLGKQKAIKVLKPEYTRNPEVRHRFQQEAQLMVKLGEHTSHICQVDDIDITDDYVALVMEYLRGQNLADYLYYHGAISPQQFIRWMEPVLLAIGYAHKQDVVHRDIKPSNLYLTEQGQIKVLDFGIAKVLSSGPDMTTTKQVIGSPRYMSPEQILTPKKVDQRSDIYSLGVCMWALLTGQKPFEGDEDTNSEYMMQHRIINQPLPPLRGQAAVLNEVIQKATAKKVEDRYPNCQLMAQDIASALDSALASDVEVSVLPEEPTRIVSQEPKEPKPVLATADKPIPKSGMSADLKRALGILTAFLVMVLGLFLIKFFDTDSPTVQTQQTAIPQNKVKNANKSHEIDDAAGAVALEPAEQSTQTNLNEAVEIVPNTLYKQQTDDGGWILVDKAKHPLQNDNVYQEIRTPSEGFIAVQDGAGKWGYIDMKGKQIIKCQFNEADDFSNGSAYATVGSYSFRVDKYGKLYSSLSPKPLKVNQ